jgi:hypothetical protein
MTPAIYIFPDHYRGDTLEATVFTIKEDGVAVDLTSAVIKIDFKQKSSTGTLQLSITIGSGITVNDAVGGKFTINSFINNWDPIKFFYDCEIIFPDGVIKTYFKGTLKVEQDITNG